MRTLLLAFILCIVIPAYEQTAKDVKVCSRRTKAPYNRPQMTTHRSANAFRFFAFSRTGAGCLIA